MSFVLGQTISPSNWYESAYFERELMVQGRRVSRIIKMKGLEFEVLRCIVTVEDDVLYEFFLDFILFNFKCHASMCLTLLERGGNASRTARVTWCSPNLKRSSAPQGPCFIRCQHHGKQPLIQVFCSYKLPQKIRSLSNSKDYHNHG